MNRDEAIGKMYKDDYDKLVRRVSFRAGGPENAEDIVQEAFTRALKYWPSFNPELRAIEAWFNGILNNSLRDFKRDERLYGMCEEFDEELIEGLPMSETNHSLHKWLVAEIKKKPDNIAEALHLHFILGYKPREVCEVLDDCEPAMVSRLIYNFREELRGEIDW